MPRKSHSYRINLEALEDRRLLSTGFIGNLARQAALEAAVAGIRVPGGRAAEMNPASRAAMTQRQARPAPQPQRQLLQRRSLGQGQRQLLQQQRLLNQQQRQLLQRQPRDQGMILSARSLDNTTIQVQLKQRWRTTLSDPAMYQIPGLNVERAIAGADGASVILKTSPQSADRYELTMVSMPARGRAAGVQKLGKIGFDGIPAAISPTAPAVSPTVLVASPPAPVASPTAPAVPPTSPVASPTAPAVPPAAPAVSPPGPTVSPAAPAVSPPAPVGSPRGNELPRVVSATSTSNTEMIVQFSEPMGAQALVAQHYEITQRNVNTESGRLIVKNARFQLIGTDDGYVINRSSVILTTESQNEISYVLRVSNVVDLDGDPMAPAVTVGGQTFDPTSARFQGTPPSQAGKNTEATLKDTDGDGLTDNEEQLGWEVVVVAVDGTVSRRTVTSDIRLADTDGDGLSDAQEAALRYDPRDLDTDDDLLSDYIEFNETYSDGLRQDTDGDGLDDGLEFTFFKTSPLFADSDGDQIADGDEIAGNRNPLVSDLPRPEVEVGSINLQLDVRFTESNASGSRDLQTKSVSTTLNQNESRKMSRSHTANVEASLTGGYESGAEAKGVFFEAGVTAGYTFQQTEESASEMQRSYASSFVTDAEITKGYTAERSVVGAVMQATVNLRNVSNLSYRVKNLQLTAFIQDPLDRAKLVPVATLLPDNEPEEGYTLGPFVTDRGPLIFSNTTIVPSLVESLMANTSGLIFRISNYDIINEDGRNFAFVSQDVVERTAGLILDYGGARGLRAKVGDEPIDENLPGDETEIHRVSTAAGRPIDGGDRRVTFDGNGKEVGITVFDGFAAIGLKRFEARFDPATGTYVDYEESAPGLWTRVDTSKPTERDRILKSYSTYLDAEGREKIFRIRGVANNFDIEKHWAIMTPDGIDNETDLRDLILKTDASVSLNFVQDLDGDLLPADVEYLLGTSDSPEPVSADDPTPRGRDTDGDGLDDRFEALIGWTVSTGSRTYQVYSSPVRKDSNFDAPKPEDDTNGDGRPDSMDYDGSDFFAAPSVWVDANQNGLRDKGEVSAKITKPGEPKDYVLDPIRKDTDGDGINDATEIIGFHITRIEDGSKQFIKGTDPLNIRTDGDTFTDGFEKMLGLDPTDGSDTDEDGDGLPDKVEKNGWLVTIKGVSEKPYEEGRTTTATRSSLTNSVDSDEDGLTDYEEFFLKTDPTSKDSDGDGIEDRLEHLGYNLGHKVASEDLGVIRTDPLDADHDNDMRSDGDEAELVDIESKRWVVRVSGAASGGQATSNTAYRVYSNPLVADADYDGLVDGEEYFGLKDAVVVYRTDPNNANTDGDKRDDGVEVKGGLNPLLADYRVTVVAEWIHTYADGDANDWGDYQIDLGVRRPDEAGAAGLSDTLSSVLSTRQWLNDEGTPKEGLIDRYYFNQLLPDFSQRSLTFSVAAGQRFSIELTIKEFGNGGAYGQIDLGGLSGLQAYKTWNKDVTDPNDGTRETNAPSSHASDPVRTVFSADSLLSAGPGEINDLYFYYNTRINPWTRVNGYPDVAIAGVLKLFYFIE